MELISFQVQDHIDSFVPPRAAELQAMEDYIIDDTDRIASLIPVRGGLVVAYKK
jgi:hypothetical protein